MKHEKQLPQKFKQGPKEMDTYTKLATNELDEYC